MKLMCNLHGLSVGKCHSHRWPLNSGTWILRWNLVDLQACFALFLWWSLVCHFVNICSCMMAHDLLAKYYTDLFYSKWDYSIQNEHIPITAVERDHVIIAGTPRPRDTSCLPYCAMSDSKHNWRGLTVDGAKRRVKRWCFSWVGTRLDHVLTTNKPCQSLFGTWLSPPLHQRLGLVVLDAPECDWCIHTFPNELHQGGKRSRVRFNRGRCENTHKLTTKPFYWGNKSIEK